MTTKAGGLGRDFDIGGVNVASDAVAAAITGKRVSLEHAEGVTFLVVKATDGGTDDDLQTDLQEHNAATGGTSQDLDVVTDYWTKSEAVLDGDETWSKTTQAAASEIAAIAGTAELEVVLAVSVHASQLSAGFNWVSLNIPDLGATDVQYTAIIPILWGLKVQRAPELMPVHQ